MLRPFAGFFSAGGDPEEKSSYAGEGPGHAAEGPGHAGEGPGRAGEGSGRANAPGHANGTGSKEPGN